MHAPTFSDSYSLNCYSLIILQDDTDNNLYRHYLRLADTVASFMKTNYYKLILPAIGAATIAVITGCRTPAEYRSEADSTAYTIVEETRKDVLQREQSEFDIESPEITLRRRLTSAQGLPAYSRATLSANELEKPQHWPEGVIPNTQSAANSSDTFMTKDGSVELTLIDALKIAARNSTSYQSAKENVFRAALKLDLERNNFRETFAGAMKSELNSSNRGDENVSSSKNSLTASTQKTLESGAALSGLIAVDLVKLLTGDRDSAWGLSADATISIPLLRGAGKHIARESLTQAERNVVYAIYEFEEFKRGLAVNIEQSFLGVMQADDRADNAKRNYETLTISTDRAGLMAKSGRLPEIQVDQAQQDQLRSYDRAISAHQSAERSLDRFKLLLGLPPDANIKLNRESFIKLVNDAEKSKKDTDSLPDDHDIIITALENRLDMRIAADKVYDAQRSVVIAADALRSEVTLLGSASVGDKASISSDDSRNHPDLSKGIFSGIINIDLAIERTAERNAFRNSLIELNQAVRSAQEKEDEIKLQVLNSSRDLKTAGEAITTQLKAVVLAERRQKSTALFLKAGRAQMRDLLEAQESLLSVRNALTDAIINYRTAELNLQSNTGLLQVTDAGIVQEHALTKLNGEDK